MSSAEQAPNEAVPAALKHAPPAQAGAAVVRHRPWSTVLLVLFSLTLVPTIAAIVFGGITRFRYSDDGPDGFRAFIGSVLVVVGTAGTLVAAALLVLLVLGRRRADAGAPRTLFGVAVAVVTLAVAALGLEFASVLADDNLGIALTVTAYHAVWYLPFALVAARVAYVCHAAAGDRSQK